MANLKEIRGRIASVTSTRQITSAMKMVAAAKLRKAQTFATKISPYKNKMAEMLSLLAETLAEDNDNKYTSKRAVKNILVIAISSNKGLCGAFNSNVLKQAQQRIDHWRGQPEVTIRVVAIGKKASEMLVRQKDLQVSSHDALLDNSDFDAVATLADSLMDDFAAQRIDRVEIIYNQFKNSLSQVLTCDQWLPVENGKVHVKGEKSNNDYIFEPSKEEIMREMIPLTLRSTFYRVVLDSLAAEHGARMTAMQKATDNATELLKDLRLNYNKARQAAITNENIEIVSGSEALKG